MIFEIMKKYLVHILTLVFTICYSAEARTAIRVKNQADFDNISGRILSSISSGEKSIQVIFSSGKYFFRENHILLDGINAEGVIISINGNGAIILPQGRVYKKGDVYNGSYNINNNWMYNMEDIPIWTSVKYASGLVEIINDKSKECRIKSAERIRDCRNCFDSFILIPHWYLSSVYRITKVEGGYIYFTANDLSHSALNDKGFNINDDFYYREKALRYKLCNVETDDDVLRIANGRIYLPSDYEEVYESETTRLLTIRNSRFKRISISGFSFAGGSFRANSSYILFHTLSSEAVTIQNCAFRGIHGTAISIYDSDNVSITNNRFEDCYYYGIRSENSSSDTRIVYNTFVNCGAGMQNTFAISCHGANYYVAYNTIQDYGYGGIEVGIWYRVVPTDKSNGIVENNRLCFMEDYSDHIMEYGLMDGGAIYLSTQNDGAIIRYNTIDGYKGAGGNRGIFCDDGAYGFQLYGNLIQNIADNDYCIASRRDGRIEKLDASPTGVQRSNTNNIIRDNIVDGDILFVGNECNNNGCIYGPNYLLVKKEERKPVVKIGNVPTIAEDVEVKELGYGKSKIKVSKTDYNKIRKSQEWRHFRTLFKK
jgi:parallel beta-helix repeat protein